MQAMAKSPLTCLPKARLITTDLFVCISVGPHVLHPPNYLSSCLSLHLLISLCIYHNNNHHHPSVYLPLYMFIDPPTYQSWLPIIYISTPHWPLINMMALGCWGKERVTLTRWSPLHWFSAHAQVSCVMGAGLSWQASRSWGSLWKILLEGKFTKNFHTISSQQAFPS